MNFTDFYSRAKGVAYQFGVDDFQQVVPEIEARIIWNRNPDNDVATKILVNTALKRSGIKMVYDAPYIESKAIEFAPIEVSKNELALGARYDKLMPPILDEKYLMGPHWELINRWMNMGIPRDTEFLTRPWIDHDTAVYHILALMRCPDLKQSIRICACAQLLDLWFEDVLNREGKSMLEVKP